MKALFATSCLLIAGCAGSSARHYPAQQQPTTRVTTSSPQHPTVASVQRCLAEAIRGKHTAGLVMLTGVESEATGSAYLRGLPQPVFNTYVTGVLRELGFAPLQPQGDAYRDLSKHKNETRPDFAVRGGVTGFDPLVSKHREAMDAGIGFGKGFGSSSANRNSETTVSIGTVHATINIETLRSIGKDRHAYLVTASGSSSADFRMTAGASQTSASILIGIGGGYAKENVSVVDVQSAALYAVRMATLMAVADHFKVSTGRCNA